MQLFYGHSLMLISQWLYSFITVLCLMEYMLYLEYLENETEIIKSIATNKVDPDWETGNAPFLGMSSQVTRDLRWDFIMLILGCLLNVEEEGLWLILHTESSRLNPRHLQVVGDVKDLHLRPCRATSCQSRQYLP